MLSNKDPIHAIHNRTRIEDIYTLTHQPIYQKQTIPEHNLFHATDRMNNLRTALVVLAALGGESCFAFTLPTSARSAYLCPSQVDSFATKLFSTPDEETPDAEGADLAAQFFQMAQAKGVSIDESDLMEEDDEDEYEEYDASQYGYDGGYGGDYGGDDEDDDFEPNIPQGAIDAFVGYDPSDIDANPTVDFSNDQLYSEVKERVLDTAGGFVEMTRGAIDDDDEGYYGDGSDDGVQEYVPPMTVPDAELTAGEVVLLVVTALKNNDNPYVNRGLEILFGYSSPGSQIQNEEGLTPAEYGQFLKETEYKALFEHLDVVSYNYRMIIPLTNAASAKMLCPSLGKNRWDLPSTIGILVQRSFVSFQITSYFTE